MVVNNIFSQIFFINNKLLTINDDNGFADN